MNDRRGSHPPPAATGEVLDFEDFYRERRDGVTKAVVLAVGRRDVGVEAADEAFTRALARWDEVAGYANPAGWVYRVAVNWARSRFRARRREVTGLGFEPGYEQRIPEPEILKAVARLPLKYRVVVVARFFLDWSLAETAVALGVPEGTVKTRQHRAVDRLREALGERP